MAPSTVRRQHKRSLRHLPSVVVSIFLTLLMIFLGAYRLRIVPLDYWGTNQSGAPTSAFHMVPAVWFQSYGVARTRPSWHRNVEVGPSTLVVPPAPYIDTRTPQPSGGISETTADAETTRQITEEDRAQVSNFYWPHIPRVTECSFSVRHPRRSGFSAVKENHATPVSRWGYTNTSYVSGCRR